MKLNSKLLLIILMVTLSNNLYSKTTKLVDNNIVTLTVIGQGRTKDDAKYNALRNAIEKTFGAFISSNTTIVNDNLIKDDIVSLSSGNIQNFEILSEIQMPDGSYSSVVKTTVSIGKLITFCESKGISVEFKGQLFAANIKLFELNKKNEIQVFKDLEKIISNIEKKLFDYSTKVAEPVVYNNDLWKILITVNAYSNSNLNKINDLLYNTLKSISINEDEKIGIGNKGVQLYEIKFNQKSYFLRSFESFNMLQNIFREFVHGSQATGYNENSTNIYNSILKFKLSNGIHITSGVDIINEVEFRNKSGMTQSENRNNKNYKKVIDKIILEKSIGLSTPSFLKYGEFSSPFQYSSISDDANRVFHIKFINESEKSLLLYAEIKFYYILKMEEIEKITQFTVSPIN